MNSQRETRASQTAPYMHMAPYRRIVPYIAVALFFLLVSFLFGRHKIYGEGTFWDGLVYAKAIRVWHAGGNPYAGDANSLLFVSPPLLIVVMGFLSQIFRGHTGWYLYLACIIVSMVSLPYLLARFYIRSLWMTPVVAIVLYAMQPHFMVERSMLSGNLAIPMYALVLLAGIAGLRNNRWLWFYAVVFAAALIKPAFLSLLLLPVLAGTRQFGKAVATAAAAVALYALQRLIMPGLYRDFELAAYRQIVLKHDFGVGTYDGFYHLSGRLHFLQNLQIASLLHALLFLILLGSLFLLRGYQDHPLLIRIWVPILLVAAIVANPRMQDYDSNVAIVPALFIWVECIRAASRWTWGLVAVAFGIDLLTVLFTRNYEIGSDAVLFGAVLLGILQAWEAHRQTTRPQQSLTQEEVAYFEQRRAS